MKYYNHGSTHEVKVSGSEVSDFGAAWPCSNLRHGDRASFTFANNGDLIDYQITHAFAGPVDRGDCPSISALASDAWKYALNKRG